MPEARTQLDDIFASRDHSRLATLRQKDPQKSLTERWKRLVAARPELAEERLGYVPQIVESGWAIIAIPEEGFAYTIGLKYRFDHPELLVAAPGLELNEFAQLLNALALHIADGNPIGPDEPVELEGPDIEIVFHPYSGEVFSRYATGYLSTFERYFDDRHHESADTLPVIWTELTVKRRATPKKKAKAATRKSATTQPASKATSTRATSKPPARKAATSKTAAGKTAQKSAAGKSAKQASTRQRAVKKATVRQPAKKTAASKKTARR